jgi:Na+-transporting NADH:ubiquinone oxidoreductase subunit NqrC
MKSLVAARIAASFVAVMLQPAEATPTQDVKNETILCAMDMLAAKVANAELECERIFEPKLATAKAREAADARAAIESARRAKRPPAKIGMSKDGVLSSNWGKPIQVNTTTTADGVREQWVYGGRQYLYFENGVLTSIQTSK